MGSSRIKTLGSSASALAISTSCVSAAVSSEMRELTSIFSAPIVASASRAQPGAFEYEGRSLRGIESSMFSTTVRSSARAGCW